MILVVDANQVLVLSVAALVVVSYISLGGLHSVSRVEVFQLGCIIPGMVRRQIPEVVVVLT